MRTSRLLELNVDRLVIAVLFIALLAMAVRTPADTDMWWHLATGRYILTTGQIPQTDPFSFTMRGQPWTNVQWLAQVGMYGLYQAGSYTALALAVAALVLISFAFIYAQMEGGAFLRAFIVVMAATASSVIWSPRPQMLSFALLAATGYILYLFRSRGINRLWLLIPMFALWGNVHGGYALGLMLLAATIAGEVMNRLLPQPGSPGMSCRQIGTLAGIAFLCGLALLASPYGLGTWALPFRTVGIRTLQGFIMEWASPDFHNLYEQPILWLILGLLAAAGFSGRRWNWTDLIVVLLFGYSAFLARRNIAALAVVIAPVLSYQVQPILEPIERWVRASGASRQQVSPRLAGILNWVIVLLVVLAALVKSGVALSPRMYDRAVRDAAPVRAVAWLRGASPRLSGPLYNSYNWGGYLLWALPEEPVFVDGRTDVYNTFLQEYVKVMFVRPGWQSVLDTYRIRTVLTERDSFLAALLATQPQWRLAYEDDQATVWTRDGSTSTTGARVP